MRYFVSQSGVEKIMVNMVDSDHGMRKSWEAEPEDGCGAILVVGNLGVAPHGGDLATTDIEAKLRKLTAINYNCHN